MEIHTLKLLSPLYYVPGEGSDPFGYREESGEILYCFKMDEKEAVSFEPDKNQLLGSLVFSGNAAGEPVAGGTSLELPSGNYLFAQEREILSREEIIAMAVEIQLEGLWQRRILEKTLYLRYLSEDGRSVTQLFRPYNQSRRASTM